VDLAAASRVRARSKVVLELGAGLLPPVPKVDSAFLESVAKNPDVVDWLISVSEKEGTRSDYLVLRSHNISYCRNLNGRSRMGTYPNTIRKLWPCLYTKKRNELIG